MQCLYGLQQLGLTFELKGGTSLSKGYQIVDRFSEDIDIRIEPPPGRDVKTGRNQDKPAQRRSREDFHDWLAQTVRIDGIVKVQRDKAFDTHDFFSGGIRLFYKGMNERVAGRREGVLLEAGFDDVTPNATRDIGSWVYDHAAGRVPLLDNRARDVARIVVCDFDLNQELDHVLTLLRKYADIPISFADACWVRMTETNLYSILYTMDSDFRIYRRHGRKVTLSMMPG